MWRFVLSDWLVRLVAAVVAGLAVVYTLQNLGVPAALEEIIAIAGPVLVFLAFLATLGPRPDRESVLWTRLRLAFGLWLALDLALVLLGSTAESATGKILTDTGYVSFYLLVLLAAEEAAACAAGTPAGSGRGARLVDAVTLAGLYLGLLVYFVLIPSRYDPLSYQATLPSYVLYTILDLAIAGRFAYLGMKAATPRWRTLLSLVSLSFLGWGVIDLLDAIGSAAGTLPAQGRPIDLVWFVPFVLATAAFRLRGMPTRSPRALGGGPADGAEAGRLLSWAPVLLLVVVGVHIGGYGFGLLGAASRGPRQVAVVLLLAVCAVSMMSKRAISRSEARFRTLIDHAPEAILVLDADSGRFIQANHNATRLFGFSAGTLGELGPEALSAPSQSDGGDPAVQFAERVEQALDGATPVFEWTVLNAAGFSIPCEARLVRLPSQGSRTIRVSITDIGERLRLQMRMRQLSQAIEQTADSVVITDSNGVIEFVNDAFVASTGFSREEAIGANPRILASGHHDQAFYADLWATILRGEVFTASFVNRRRSGELFHDERVITPLKDSRGRITHFVATGRDITGRVEDQRRLQYLASHDPLTELPNRSFVLERLEHTIRTSRRHGHRFGVLFLDLDDFKVINDILGHSAGDEALRTIAGRILGMVREGDTVGRMGGDEFLILAVEIAGPETLSLLAERVLEAVRQPIIVEGQEAVTTCSLGVAAFPADGADSKTLIRAADAAMFRAKERGPGHFEFATPETDPATPGS